MGDKELADEDARGRLVGFISLGIVAAFSASFFFLWMVQKDASGTRDVASLLVQYEANTASFIASRFFFALGVLLTGAILVHLALAIRSRYPSAPSILLTVCVAGPVLMAIVIPAMTFLEVATARDFVAGTIKTNAEAERLTSSTGFTIAQIFQLVASLLYALAWTMSGVFSVRVGLLTKVVGYVGVAIGLMSILPNLAGLVMLVAVFWVGAVTIMLLGRGTQKPPAWVLGRPVPWSEVAANSDEIRREEDAANTADSEPE